MNYRSEIDGLRALAVLPVILFHAGFEWFSGGFVGVDVFFVISGYLITSIIISELAESNFSIINFYERRARRILPALFLVMATCLPLAWLFMFPYQLVDFSESLIATSLFFSNIFFFFESGYFEVAAEEKPLLHTWSLAVEEQFYLIFPIFLVMVWRFGKKGIFWIIAFILLSSLLLSEWGWRNSESGNFYLAPTRAWELLSGSLVALYLSKKQINKNEFLSILGFFSILISFFIFDKTTPFPSLHTLMPVIGVVLVIIYTDHSSFIGKILSTKILVGIGLISYSAYLWHQPLFAFARIQSTSHPSVILMITLSFLGLVLAWLSWRYIEKPFRDRRKFSRNAIFSMSLIGILFFSIIGLVGIHYKGFENRFDSHEKSLLSSAASTPLRAECHFQQNRIALNKEPCIYFDGHAELTVLGDSHAAELAYTVAQKLKKHNISVIHNTISACPHTYKLKNQESICTKWHDMVVGNILNNQKLKFVVLSYRNEKHLHKTESLNSLIQMIRELENGGKKVILVLQAPLLNKDIHKYIRYAIKNKRETVYGITKEDWNQIYISKEDLINALSERIIVIDPADIFCTNKDCKAIDNNHALYFDDNHMSLHGSALIADEIIKTLRL